MNLKLNVRQAEHFLGLRLGLKVEKFSEEVKGTRHLLVEPFCRVLRDLVVHLEISHS